MILERLMVSEATSQNGTLTSARLCKPAAHFTDRMHGKLGTPMPKNKTKLVLIIIEKTMRLTAKTIITVQ